MGKEELFRCRECSQHLPAEAYRLSQLTNPRPICNPCATHNALSHFASDLATSSNARVLHNPSPSSKPASPPEDHQNAKECQAVKKPNSLYDIPTRYLRFPHWCAGCAREVPKASKCMRCLKFSYCSSACQASHWKLHKQRECRPYGIARDETLRRFDWTVQEYDELVVQIQGSDVTQCWQGLVVLQQHLERAMEELAEAKYLLHIQALCCEVGLLSELLTLMETLLVSIVNSSDHVSSFIMTDQVEIETLWQVLLLFARVVQQSTGIAVQSRISGAYALLLRACAMRHTRVSGAAHLAINTVLEMDDPIEGCGLFYRLGGLDFIIATLENPGEPLMMEKQVILLQASATCFQCVQYDSDIRMYFLDHPKGIATLTTIVDQACQYWDFDRVHDTTIGHRFLRNALTIVYTCLSSSECQSDELMTGFHHHEYFQKVIHLMETCLASTESTLMTWSESLWSFFIPAVAPPPTSCFLEILDLIMAGLPPGLDAPAHISHFWNIRGPSIICQSVEWYFETQEQKTKDARCRVFLAWKECFARLIFNQPDFHEDLEGQLQFHQSIGRVYEHTSFLSLLHRFLEEEVQEFAHDGKTMNFMLLYELLGFMSTLVHHGNALDLEQAWTLMMTKVIQLILLFLDPVRIQPPPGACATEAAKIHKSLHEVLFLSMACSVQFVQKIKTPKVARSLWQTQVSAVGREPQELMVMVHQETNRFHQAFPSITDYVDTIVHDFVAWMENLE